MTNKELTSAFIKQAIEDCAVLNQQYVEVEKALCKISGLDLNKLTNIHNLRLSNLKTVVSLGMVEEEKKVKNLTKK